MSFIVSFVRVLAQVLNLAILARVFMSWLPVNRDSRFVAILLEITEPILGPIRRLVPGIGGLDISPMLGLLLIQVLERVLLTMLSRLT
ncbi:MAG: YggT family protein [Chloroflexota bacterium]